MNKKICFVVPQLYPDYVGGAEVFNYYFINKLSTENQVSYITLSENNIARANKIKLKSRKSIYQQFEIFLRILRSSKNEVFVVSFMKTKWIYIITYPLLNIFFCRKYIIIIHGGGMMPWSWRWPYNFFFKQAKTIFGVSNAICNEYYKRTGVVINYLPPLIPFKIASKHKLLLRKTYNLNADEKIFLIVGSLKKIKNPLVAIEALGLICNRVLNKEKVRLLIAGEGPLKDQIVKIINKKGLQDFVCLLGNVPREMISEYYKLSDYYIICSDFEGTPISLLEAMYNKLVIIGSNAPGINNIVADSGGGFLFNNSNPIELKEIMIDVIHNDHTLKRNNAYNYFIKNFEYTKLTNEFYSKI
jgi:glycosyltransferase involved in cell wall biosynthesis